MRCARYGRIPYANSSSGRHWGARPNAVPAPADRVFLIIVYDKNPRAEDVRGIHHLRRPANTVPGKGPGTFTFRCMVPLTESITLMLRRAGRF